MSDIDKPLPNDAPNVTLTIRMIMNGKEVGSIIGKGGEIINNIREESGAKIHISDGSVPERIVTVTGPTNAIFKSFNMICKKFEDDGHRDAGGSVPRPPITLRLVVPASQCGSLIGKGGSKIKEIREVTGASIQVASEMLPQSTERTVTISGTKDAITQCIYHICCVMLESPPKGTTIPYTPKALSSVLGAARTGRGNNADNPLASLLGLGGLNSSSALAAIASLAGTQLNRDRRDSREDRNSSSTTYEMSIPNDLIGCIIGKGGSKIGEIRNLSGAMIRISKSDEGGEESHERHITIAGNADSVALAKSLINMSLDIHKSSLESRDSDRGSTSSGGSSSRERERDRDRDRGDRGGNLGGLAQLLAKPETLTALQSLASLSTLSNFGGGLLGALGGGAAAGSSGGGGGQVTGVHRSGGRYGGNSRSREDDRGRDSKRSKFAPY